MQEIVVLVDKHNNAIGTALKATVHGRETPLHRAFSSFLFREDGMFLVSQRSHKKKTWPLVWTNSCCGHPDWEESFENAVIRRVEFELGARVAHISMMLPEFRYCATRDGVMENEFCPVLVGLITSDPRPNEDEVETVRWMTWADWCAWVERDSNLSEWCREETRLLNKAPAFQQWLAKFTDGHLE